MPYSFLSGWSRGEYDWLNCFLLVLYPIALKPLSLFPLICKLETCVHTVLPSVDSSEASLALVGA